LQIPASQLLLQQALEKPQTLPTVEHVLQRFSQRMPKQHGPGLLLQSPLSGVQVCTH
jgi:hypothetical protein